MVTDNRLTDGPTNRSTDIPPFCFGGEGINMKTERN